MRLQFLIRNKNYDTILQMNVLIEYVQTEISIQRSKFICEAFPVTTQNQARSVLKLQKEQYFNATHVVHAFCIGLKLEILGCSDDGEPSGTAGRPMLEVLKNQHLTNILITATRYFGGILLGQGGLVKAYTECAKSIIECAHYSEYIDRKEFVLTADYSYYDLVKRLLAEKATSILHEEFYEKITITAVVAKNRYTLLCTQLDELSNGTIRIQSAL